MTDTRGHRALRPAPPCEPCGTVLEPGPRAFWTHTAACDRVQPTLLDIAQRRIAREHTHT